VINFTKTTTVLNDKEKTQKHYLVNLMQFIDKLTYLHDYLTRLEN